MVENITWASMGSAGGVAAVLCFAIVPLGKAFGLRGNGCRIFTLCFGLFFGLVGCTLAGGWIPDLILKGLLVGLVGATSAMGTYELIKPFKTAGTPYP